MTGPADLGVLVIPRTVEIEARLAGAAGGLSGLSGAGAQPVGGAALEK